MKLTLAVYKKVMVDNNAISAENSYENYFQNNHKFKKKRKERLLKKIWLEINCKI